MNIFDVLDRLKRENWPTLEGLIYYSVALFLIPTAIILFLKQLGVGDALRTIGIPVNVWWIIIFLLTIQISHLLIWKIQRNGFYASDKLIILFAINSTKESLEYINEVKKNVRRQLALNGLNNIIEVQQLPPDVEFSSPQQSEKYARENNINFLIWGDTSTATRGGSKITILNINYSYIFTELKPQHKIQFLNDLQKAMQKPPWGEIDQMNSIIGIQIATENIFEISLFTLAACLVTSRDVIYHLKAVSIFEELRKLLKARRGDQNFQQAKFILQKVNDILLNNLVGLSFYYVFIKHDFQKGIEFAEKALFIDQNNFAAHLNLAHHYWKTGNEKLAREHAQRAENLNPSSNLVRLNRAFFRIFDRRFEAGLRTYKKLHSIDNTPLAVCEFIEEEFDKHPDNLGLLFAFAWLSINFGDEGRGTKSMNKFLSLAKADPQYATLIEEAKKTLDIK